MTKAVTLADIAKLAGVHVSTVSRALNPRDTHGVNSGQAARIRDISEKLGYVQNAAASTLRTKRSGVVGVIVPDLTDPIFPPIIRGIEDFLGRHDYFAILGNTDGDPDREETLVKQLKARGVDGFILCSIQRVSLIAADLIADGMPVVTVARKLDSGTASSVCHDEHDGIARAVTHMASLGHREIAYISGPLSVSTGHIRLNAFGQQRGELGLPEDAERIVVARSYTVEEGERCLEELLARDSSFTAVVCANDCLAIGAIAALQRRGIAVPGDVSVTGFNDMQFVERMNPPLTTVRVHKHEEGYRAAELVLEMIDTPPADRTATHTLLPVEFIVRASTKPHTVAAARLTPA
tara:strand:- start:7189 stop:8241 length:1053 start_codon:yes stop_codon:yes gene_type:complete